MIENERRRLEEKEARRLEAVREFDKAQEKRLKTGKVLVITASVLSFIFALFFAAGGIMLSASEPGLILSVVLFTAACVIFPAFMMAGFNWARDGFIVCTVIKAILVLGILLRGDFRDLMNPVTITILLLWAAFYAGEALLFGFSQNIRDYQYDCLTRPESFE